MRVNKRKICMNNNYGGLIRVNILNIKDIIEFVLDMDNCVDKGT